MNQKTLLAGILALAFGGSFLLQACSDGNPVSPQLPPDNPGPSNSVAAVQVGSPEAVANGVPGSYYISEDRTRFYLRCPGGNCTKHNVLALAPSSATYVWTLTGEPGKPTLSPSIHWFETDGVTTHWHGWLRNGYFDKL